MLSYKQLTFCILIPHFPICEASELVHFRHRIGKEGVELI